MSAQDMPTEEATRRPISLMGMGGGMMKPIKSRPFEPIDNPTLSPHYDDAGSLSPSPVPDWSLVREDPSDHPEYAPRGRNARSSAVVAPRIGGVNSHSSARTAAPAPCPTAAPAPGPSADLHDLDSLLLENGNGNCGGDIGKEHHTRGRDWADDFDHGPPVSPKKRRVDPLMNDSNSNDMNDALDFPMQMPMPLSLELDLDHANVDCPPEPHRDMQMDMHHHLSRHHDLDMHPDMHPEMAYSYEDEEELHQELHLHTMPMPMPLAMPLRHPRLGMMHARPYPHAHMHHHAPPEFMHEMEMYPPMEHEPPMSPHHQPPMSPHARRNPCSRSTPSANAAVGSPQIQPRRMVTMGRHPHPPRSPMYGNRNRYMNAYVPNVAVPMGGSPYYRRPYARQPYRYMNPANLPSPGMRQAYHLSPMTPKRRLVHGPPPGYFMGHEDEVFHHQAFFADEEEQFALMDERSPTSVAAMNATPQPAQLKRMSLPAMKFSSPNSLGKPAPSDDRKPSPSLAPRPAVPSPPAEEEEDDEETEVVHFSQRKHISLSIDEDANWLSEFQSFVRMEFLEIFRATQEDVKFRNTSRKVAHKQLGIRCRFCAHVHPGSRARRSSAYPSSTAQIYQSFNMMIRDHFPRCEHVPKESMEMFHKLKGRNNQGAADSKHFWSYAAEKLGMVDSEAGIFMDDDTQRAARGKLPFAANDAILVATRAPPVLLLTGEDRELVSPFLYELISRVQRVNLLDCECRSTRKNLKVGLPGFGCRYCVEAGRLGFSRIFPTKRKGLPEKANDMYEHMRRCALCPREVKTRLESLRPKPEEVNISNEKVFFDRFWARLNA